MQPVADIAKNVQNLNRFDPFILFLPISVRKSWFFLQLWMNSRSSVSVSGGPLRVSEHRRLLPDIVRQAESTRGPEMLMGQMRSLHCEGQSFTSWEQSNTGIKSHIFRVMWPLTAATPPCARACPRPWVYFQYKYLCWQDLKGHRSTLDKCTCLKLKTKVCRLPKNIKRERYVLNKASPFARTVFLFS